MAQAESGGEVPPIPQEVGEVAFEYAANEPYDWRFQQFVVLEDLGYPVDLEVVQKRQVRQELEASGHDGRASPLDAYRLMTFSKWHRPITDEPFAPWIQSIGLPQDWLSDLDNYGQDALLRHPGAILPEAITHGYVRRVARYNNEARFQSPRTFEPSGSLHEIIRGSLVAAGIRYADILKMDDEAANWLAEDDEPPRRTDWALYRTYLRNGQRVVTEVEIRAIIKDYYLMLGSLIPAFASYRE